MPELYEDYKTQLPPIDAPSALEPLPAKTLARRRRMIRYGGLMKVMLTLGMSAIPGPKGSSNTIEILTEHGMTTQVRHFYYSRHFGLPFMVGRLDYNDDGSIRNVSAKGEGFLGNFWVSLAIVIVSSILIGRRRRDD
jgi:hypothetical protein